MSRQIQEHDVSGTDLSPAHNKRAFALINESLARMDALAPEQVSALASQGTGLAAAADPTAKVHTGTLTGAELVFDITKACAGRPVESIDALVTVTCSGTAATGNLTTVSFANTVNDDYFTLPVALEVDDELVSVVFFYDKDAASVTVEDDTHILIDISGDTTDAEVAATTRAAINAVVGIQWTFGAPAGATITGTYATVGTVGNATWTESVANAGFLVTSSTGGIDATLAEFAASIETLDLDDSPPRTVAATTTPEDDHDEAGTDKVVTFTPASYEITAEDTVLLVLDVDLRKTGDSITIQAVRLNFEAPGI